MVAKIIDIYLVGASHSLTSTQVGSGARWLQRQTHQLAGPTVCALASDWDERVSLVAWSPTADM